MPSFNSILLVGNLTRDIELKNTKGGGAVCDIGLAVNDRYKGSNGEWVESCMFIDCTCFGRSAEVAAELLSKGSPVLVAGRLKLDSWERDGQKHQRHKVFVERLQLLDPPKKGERQSSTPRQSAPVQVDDSEVPF